MRFSYLIIVLALALSACKTGERKAPNGFEVKVIKEGEGEYAEPGKFLVLNMLYKDSKDSVWNDTRTKNIPVVILVPDTTNIKNEKGMESAFRVMKKGDSVQLVVTAKSLFENTWQTQVPAGVNPDDKITFLVGCKEVTDREGIQKIQTEIQAREMEKMQKLAVEQMALDSAAIDAYLATNNIKAEKATKGLRYVITKLGNGPRPSLESTVKVNYKGSLLENGTVFDQSQAPIEFPLANLIQGWQIGFQLLPKGSKATLYIPSTLGYGQNGSPPVIPANANLVFEVELIDFK
ncbi:MAG TPA: FKBP-type peptidyl-prolyl cis-trans isomerase [Cyclobacteriaceae bacterium]|nr:FKBP-type peptidyl-prolyl cis-trans isomerase [Cyclobacteriaceae bacterium]